MSDMLSEKELDKLEDEASECINLWVKSGAIQPNPFKTYEIDTILRLIAQARLAIHDAAELEALRAQVEAMRRPLAWLTGWVDAGELLEDQADAGTSSHKERLAVLEQARAVLSALAAGEPKP